jgi:hypothetical protein
MFYIPGLTLMRKTAESLDNAGKNGLFRSASYLFYSGSKTQKGLFIVYGKNKIKQNRF